MDDWEEGGRSVYALDSKSHEDYVTDGNNELELACMISEIDLACMISETTASSRFSETKSDFHEVNATDSLGKTGVFKNYCELVKEIPEILASTQHKDGLGELYEPAKFNQHDLGEAFRSPAVEYMATS